MSSIVSNMNAERNNRWLLIGALVLAVVAGVLIFFALANLNSDDGASSSASTGDSPVLIAKENIAAGAQLNADMFRSATFATSDVIANPITSADAIVGLTAKTDIIKGQQLSQNWIVQGTEEDNRTDTVSFRLQPGQRGVAIGVTDETIVGGHVQPGDRVDVVVSIKERALNGVASGDQEYLRIHTVLQSIEVVAVADFSVQGVTALDADGNLILPTEEQSLDRRPEDPKPISASTAVLAITPEQVQELMLQDQLGDITLSLRAYGDEEVRQLQDIVVPIYDN